MVRRSLAILALGLIPAAALAVEGQSSLEPWQENLRYWAYRGEPRLLLGGSSDDNLFQVPDLTSQLDRLREVGGNYVRNTMSDRRERGFEVYPFARRADGRYDLRRWNPEYWRRFDAFLEETAARGIFVQIEVWDRFDYAQEAWLSHPYNPVNNVNYGAARSGLAARYPEPAYRHVSPFFETPPELKNNRTVLRFQKRFVNKLLSHALPYEHVLYCISNETSGAAAWGEYWAEHIHRRAARARRVVYVTEMWDDWKITSSQHERTLARPDLYGYADISQNNHQSGDRHWERFQAFRARTAERPMPLNAVKTYGADGGPFGTSRDGLERWWRHLIGGAAAVRFHRPGSGLGLSAPVARSIETARVLESHVRLWDLAPANQLLGERRPNEAFAAAKPGAAYVLYFPDGGAVTLDLEAAPGPFEVIWLDVLGGGESSRLSARGGSRLRLEAPAAGHWVAVLVAAAP